MSDPMNAVEVKLMLIFIKQYERENKEELTYNQKSILRDAIQLVSIREKLKNIEPADQNKYE
jgi:hypothetical protein